MMVFVICWVKKTTANNEVFDLELGALFGTRARMGLSAIMTYAGGAYIHTRKEYLGFFGQAGGWWVDGEVDELMG